MSGNTPAELIERQLGFELLSIFKGATTESIDRAVERIKAVYRWHPPGAADQLTVLAAEREEVWLRAWCTVAGTFNAKQPDCTRYADACLKEFDARFPPPPVTEGDRP